MGHLGVILLPIHGWVSPLTFNQRLYRDIQNGLANRDHHCLDNPNRHLSPHGDCALVLLQAKVKKKIARNRCVIYIYVHIYINISTELTWINILDLLPLHQLPRHTTPRTLNETDMNVPGMLISLNQLERSIDMQIVCYTRRQPYGIVN